MAEMKGYPLSQTEIIGRRSFSMRILLEVGGCVESDVFRVSIKWQEGLEKTYVYKRLKDQENALTTVSNLLKIHDKLNETGLPVVNEFIPIQISDDQNNSSEIGILETDLSEGGSNLVLSHADLREFGSNDVIPFKDGKNSQFRQNFLNQDFSYRGEFFGELKKQAELAAEHGILFDHGDVWFLILKPDRTSQIVAGDYGSVSIGSRDNNIFTFTTVGPATQKRYKNAGERPLQSMPQLQIHDENLNSAKMFRWHFSSAQRLMNNHRLEDRDFRSAKGPSWWPY